MLLVEAEVENGPQAARDTRDRIATLRSEVGPDMLANVTLLVSELVTNAYRHSGTPAGAPLTLRVSMKNRVLRVEVQDRGESKTGPHLREPDETGGWGLHIVETLADRWGTQQTRAGSIVWFELVIDERDDRERHGR